jgi:hypothetical protein
MVPSICISVANQVRILDEDERIVLNRQIDTTRADLNQVFAGRGQMRILLESSTASEWVAPRRMRALTR